MSDQRQPTEQPRPETFRLAGFPVQASPTVLLLFLLISFTTATGLLPATAPGASSGAYWAGGIIASALLMGSLLVHELAHAIVARRHGVPVESISFWLFGGLARFTSPATTPRSEWRIAAVGPATNLVLGAAGVGIGFALSAAAAPGVVVAVAGYFASINLLLGAFNLLPAAPLDGGRILRALLWRRHGDRGRATVTAAKAGQLVGAALVGVGMAQLLFSSAIGGIWTAIIGFFIFGSARAEAQETTTRDALAGLRVRDLLPAGEPSQPVPAAPAWHTIGAFLEAYRRTGDTRTVLPLQGFDGTPAGLVSLAQLAAVPADQRDTVRLAAVAAPLDQIAVTNPDEELVELLARLRRPSTRNLAAARLAGHALVLRDGLVVGVVTPADFVRAMQLAKLSGPPARPPSTGVDARSSHDASTTPRHATS